MATDGPTPQPCDAQIRAYGVHVFETAGVPSNAMEAWVRCVANVSGQPTDWYFAGDRAVVKTLGDVPRVEAAIEQLRPMLEYFQERS